jgi:DNA processing protein
MKIQELHIDDSEYPDDLRQIADPPPILYYTGDLSILKKLKVAIVGTRMATAYGESQAFNFAKDLSLRDVCIVSGLAYGIDGAAHREGVAGASRFWRRPCRA